MKINSSFRENNSEITPFIFFISMLYTSLVVLFISLKHHLYVSTLSSFLSNNSIKLIQ